MANGNTHLTTAALRVVLAEEEPRAMTEVLRDLERARMTAEDYRGAVLELLQSDDEDQSDDGLDPITCLGCGEDMNLTEIFIRSFTLMASVGIWTDVAPGGRIVCHMCKFDRCPGEGWAVEEGQVLVDTETRCVLCNYNNRHEFCPACQS